MAITAGSALGTGASNSGTGSTTLTITTSANLTVGQVAIVTVACDNVASSDSQTSLVTGVTDTAGNAWTKLGEYTNSGGGAANGVTESLWMTRAGVQLNSGQTITITFGSSIIEKAAVAHSFNVGAALALSTSLMVNGVDSGVSFGSQSFSSLPSIERLYYRGVAREANSSGALTPTSSWTAVATSRSRNNANAVAARGEFRILTGTGATSNPEATATGLSAGVFVALEESSGGAGNPHYYRTQQALAS